MWYGAINLKLTTLQLIQIQSKINRFFSSESSVNEIINITKISISYILLFNVLENNNIDWPPAK